MPSLYKDVKGEEKSMRKNKITTVIILFALAIAMMTMVTHSSLRAESKSDMSDKLEKVLQQQKEILDKLDTMKEELSAIKLNTNRC